MFGVEGIKCLVIEFLLTKIGVLEIEVGVDYEEEKE
jgi:hypothetical protein